MSDLRRAFLVSTSYSEGMASPKLVARQVFAVVVDHWLGADNIVSLQDMVRDGVPRYALL